MAEIVVIGAGIAGLASALLLARCGHDVAVVEADTVGPSDTADDALARWPRPGVPQFGLGHNFHALGRRILRATAPDVLDDLLAFGVREIRFGERIPERFRRPEDADLVALAARRPVFEWMLRRAVQAERRVHFRTGARVDGVVVTDTGAVPRVRGVSLADGSRIEGEWVIDGSGRTSRLPLWLRAAGIAAPEEVNQPSGTLYYARHFRLLPGVRAPAGDWLFGPTGDLGYLRFSLLQEDGGHFVVTLNTPPSDLALKRLREPDAWMAAALACPPLAEWLSAGVSEPVTSVFTMGGLRNTLRRYRPSGTGAVVGLIPVADALCHTNPTQGWGVSLALFHARRLAETLEGARVDPRLATARLVEELVGHAEPYFAVAAGEDRERARIAASGRSRWTDTGNSLFCRKVAYPQALRDPALFRAVMRRIHLLDHPGRLTSDHALLARARALHDGTPAPVQAQAGPERARMLELIGAGQ